MSNVAGKAYGMNVITPMRPSRTWINRLLFAVGRLHPPLLAGLLNLSIIHFARWVIIPRAKWPGLEKSPHPENDYMLFVSNFNGTWDQYIDAFSDGIPNGLDLFWYSSTGYPGSIPNTPFKNYIRRNQIDTDYYYNATPGSAQRDIKSALRVWAAIDVLASQQNTLAAGAFADLYAAMTRAIQNNLPSAGLAPIASIDTQRADANRSRLTQHFYTAQDVAAGSIANAIDSDT
jgi:hypothetical protein